MRAVYQLIPKEIAEIEEAIRQDKRAEVKQRATVIRLLHPGHKSEVVAEQQMVSVPTVTTGINPGAVQIGSITRPFWSILRIGWLSVIRPDELFSS